MKIELNEEQKESLITSLLGFVRRVSSGVEGVPGEAQILPEIVRLLLGIGDSRLHTVSR